ncbi:MAG: hypothetical protein ChlgKO_10560 [Chlamydiales bacterium]
MIETFSKKDSLEFQIVISGRKALPFAKDCITSIQAQQSANPYSVIYIDDNSQYREKEKEELKQLLKSVNGKVEFLTSRHYQVHALAKGVAMIKNKNAVVCFLDGDDYLLPFALETLSEHYKNPDTIMTYGNALVDFRPYQNQQIGYFSDKSTVNTEYSEKVWKERSFRQDGFRCFHLKTFRRWLWDYINPSDFLRESGQKIRASGDSAYIYPMLEMLADPKHVVFIEKPLYVYRLHDHNVHNHDKKSQREDLDYLRFKKPPYAPLDRKIIEKKKIQ